MAEAVPQGPRHIKWNVIDKGGQIEHRGASEVEARKLAADLTKKEEAHDAEPKD